VEGDLLQLVNTDEEQIGTYKLLNEFYAEWSHLAQKRWSRHLTLLCLQCCY